MENDPITALHIRIASLETELRLLKEELANSAAGGTYIINLLAQQQFRISPSPEQETAIQTSVDQLHARVNNLIDENMSLRAQIAAASERNVELLQASIDALREINDAQERELKTLRDAHNLHLLQQQNAKIEHHAEFGSWFRGDIFANDVPESVERWVTAVASQNSEQASESASHEVDSRLSMEVGPSASAAGQEKSEKPVELEAGAFDPNGKILTIETDEGELFYIETAPALTSTEEANKRPLRHERRSLSPRIAAYEHNRLAGVATFIDDFDRETYAAYWQQYASEHRDHSARQWREYYEAEIRPAYRKKMAGEVQAAEKVESSGDEGKELVVWGAEQEEDRKDSVVPGGCEPCPLVDIDLETIEEEFAVASIEEKQPEAAAVPRFIHYNASQLRDCCPFARSVVKKSQRIAPDDADFSNLLEMRNVREVPMTAYTGADIKEVIIKASSASSRRGKLPKSHSNTFRIKANQ
jgi:hypothetical protein